MADPLAAARLLAPGAQPLVGMVHLPALAGPGSPGIPTILERVQHDARAYAAAGFDAVLVENLGDAPYPKTQSPPHVAALLARAVAVATETTGLPVGVNVLRNDALGAAAACYAGGGSFLRVNVLTGAAVTDQGIIEGVAHELRGYLRSLGRDHGDHRLLVLADIDVKHSAPLAARPLDELAEEAVGRAGADVLLVSGTGSGRVTDLAHVGAVARGASGAPVWVASGVTAEALPDILRVADGAIVGTAAKQDGDLHAPVDPARAASLAKAAGKRPRST